MVSKKILFDSDIFYLTTFGGISRYFTEIIRRIQNSGDTEAILPVKYSDNIYLKQISSPSEFKPIPNPYGNFLPMLDFKGKGFLFRLLEKIAGFPKPMEENRQLVIDYLIKGDFSVFHTTYYNDYFLPCLGNKPLVVTIHDMIPELFPEYFGNDPLVKMKKSLIDRADHIISVSENTKNDLIRIYKINPEKVTVIYHGVPELKTEDQRKINLLEIRSKKPYLLYNGLRKGYKNFSVFLKAMLEISKRNPALNLIITGPEPTEGETKEISSLGLDKNIFHLKADDRTLRILYSEAEAFIYPSLYEGFGLPILEAFSNDCPVIASKTSCFPEIAGDAALYFDPFDHLDIAEKTGKVLYDKTLSEALIRSGKERMKKFSWDLTTLETLQVYERLI